MKTLRPILWFIMLVSFNACAPAAAPVVSQNGISISNAVILVEGGAMGGMNMSQTYAGYLQIKNNATTADQLVGARCDFSELMLHETSITGGIASMKEISSVDLPAGATVEFKTGGLHLMFTNLKRELKVGETVDLILRFKNAGEVPFKATITARG
jgi:periplasmic copper chaperone A